MSLSTLSASTGNVAATTAVAQTQAIAGSAPPPPQTNSAQPILMVPTKPPLSPAVMAELIGRQSQPYGSVAPANSNTVNADNPVP